MDVHNETITKSNTTGVTCGAGIAYSFRTPEFTPQISVPNL